MLFWLFLDYHLRQLTDGVRVRTTKRCS